MPSIQGMRGARGLFLILAALLVIGIPGRPRRTVADDEIPASEPPTTFGFYALEKARWEDEERVREALRQPISVDFDETPLREALESVAERVGANVRYELRDDPESSFSAPISLAAAETEAFKVFLALFESTDGSFSWEYDLDGGSIVITDYRNSLATRMYDLTKLVELGFRVETGAPHEIDSYRDDHNPGSWGFFTVDGFGEAEGVPELPSRSPLRIVGLSQWTGEPPAGLVRAVSLQKRSSTLKQLIQYQTSGPWFERDGVGGTASMFGTRLAVRQTERNHVEIEELLDKLTQVADQPPGGPPVPLFGGLEGRGYAAMARRGSVSYDSVPFVDVLEDMSRRFDFPYRIEVYDADPESRERILNHRITLSMDERFVYDILSEVGELSSLSFGVVSGTVWFDDTSGCYDLTPGAAYNVRDFKRTLWPDLMTLIQNETEGPWLELDGIGGRLELLDNGLLIVNQTPWVHGEVALLLEHLREQRANEAFPNSADDEWTTRIYPIENADALNWLVDAVQAFVRPGSWDANDSEAAIRGGGHTLIIRQTGAGHRDVSRLLERIEWAHSYVREHLPEQDQRSESEQDD